MKEVLLFLITVIAIGESILWYYIKDKLQKNGYKVNYYYGHFKYLSNFFNLIQKEENAKTKFLYKNIYYCVIVGLLLFLVVTVLLFKEK